MSARKSLFFSFVDRYASLVITIVSSMVVARLLTPAEIGVFSVVMVLLGFASTFREMGAGQYMVQEKELTIDRIRAVWTVQLGLGLAMAMLVLAASYPVAQFYNEPRILDVMLVLALNYAFNPFGSLTYAWLTREMRFESIALMRFSSAITGALLSCCLAWQGWGPISLALGSLATTVTNSLVALYFRPTFFPWKPGFSEVRRVVSYGSKVTLGSMVEDFANAPELLLGKFQGMSATGYYSRANGLVQMFHRLFVDAVGSFCLPWFARQAREHGSFVEPFVKATAYVTAFGWSFCLAVVCLAQPMVRLLYGPQWDTAVDLSRILAVSMFFAAPSALCAAALMSCGAAGAVARTTIYSAIQSIALAALGATVGLTATGIALVVAALLNSALWLHATSRHIGLDLRSLVPALKSSALVACCAAIGPALALWLYGPYPNQIVMPLGVGGVLGLLGFVGAVVYFQHPLAQEVQTLTAKFRPRRV
jgi:O-antigen/teichoic acid export membrane protein